MHRRMFQHGNTQLKLDLVFGIRVACSRFTELLQLAAVTYVRPCSAMQRPRGLGCVWTAHYPLQEVKSSTATRLRRKVQRVSRLRQSHRAGRRSVRRLHPLHRNAVPFKSEKSRKIQQKTKGRKAFEMASHQLGRHQAPTLAPDLPHHRINLAVEFLKRVSHFGQQICRSVHLGLRLRAEAPRRRHAA